MINIHIAWRLKMKLFKKMLSFLLSLTLAAGMLQALPVRTLADDPGEIITPDDGIGNEIKTAAIGETWYETFAEALEAVQDGETIVLGEDFDDTSCINITFTASTVKTFTLDLNGHEISGSSSASTSTLQVGYANVTVINGSIVSPSGKSANRGGIYAKAGSVLTLGAGLTVSGSTTGNYGYIGSYGSSSAKAKLVIDGAVILQTSCSNSSSSNAGIYLASNSSIDVKSGTISSRVFAFGSDGPLSISGGAFTSTGTLGKSSNGTIEITGGYFYSDPDGYYDPARYEWIEDTSVDGCNGYIGEKTDMQAVASIDGTEYVSFDEAYEAAVDGDTIVLLSDCPTVGGFDENSNGKANRTYTVDLNGHTLFYRGTSYLVRNKSALTITDSVGGGMIDATDGTIGNNGLIYNNIGKTITISGDLSIVGSGNYLLNASGFASGTYAIDGATLTNTNSSGYAVRINGGSSSGFTGTLRINSGTINGNIQTNRGTVLVTGGTVNGNINASSGSVSIEGGFIDGSFGSNDSVSISGGWFKTQPAQSYYMTGCEWVPDTETYPGYIGFVAHSYIAELELEGETTSIRSMAEGIAAIGSSQSKTGTITLLDDYTYTDEENIEISGDDLNVTIDLFGYTLTKDCSYRLFYIDHANVTVKNGTLESADRTYTRNNGSAIYLRAGQLTLSNVVVAGFRTGVNSSGIVRNSGAIHIVRDSSSGEGGVLNLVGSEFTNCSSQGHGGAISVGSGCTLNMDADSTIHDCSAAQGGAVYIDWSEDKDDIVFGTAVFGAPLSSLIADCESTDEESACPVWSCGFASVSGSLVTDEAEGVYQYMSAARFTSAGASLSDTISLRMYLEIAQSVNDAGKAVVLEAAIGNSDKAAISPETDTDGKTYYEISGICADMMAETVHVSVTFEGGVYYDDVEEFAGRDVLNGFEYSVAQYCEGAHAAFPDDGKLMSLIACAMKYGKIATEHYNASHEDKFAELELSDWAAALTDGNTSVDASASVRSSVKSGNYAAYNDGTAYALIKSAYLNVASQVTVAFAFKTNDPASLEFEIGGTRRPVADLSLRAGTSDQYVYEMAPVGPAKYDDAVTVKLYSGSDLIQTVTYSVNSYCVQKAASADIGGLVTAMYWYGKAAETYKGTNGYEVVDDNEGGQWGPLL